MAVTVYIPTPFRRATGNRDRVEVERARRRRRCSTSWSARYGGLKGLVRNDAGRGAPPRQHLREQRGRSTRSGLGTPLQDGDEVAIIPALAGRRAR